MISTFPTYIGSGLLAQKTILCQIGSLLYKFLWQRVGNNEKIPPVQLEDSAHAQIGWLVIYKRSIVNESGPLSQDILAPSL